MNNSIHNRRSFITLTAAVIAIIASAMETDIFLPAMPSMQKYFAVTEAEIELLVSINLLGLCLASLCYGPLSDSFGRKQLLLVGTSIFAVSGLAVAYSDDFAELLFWRFIQGIGSSAGFVIPGAIIYDLFSKEQAAKIMGFYSSLITSVMAAAPLMGSYLFLHYGWRSNFSAIAVLAVLALLAITFFVDESLPLEKRPPFNVRNIAATYWRILHHRLACYNLAIICAIFSAYMVYITNLSLIFIDYLQVPPTVFSWYQAAVLMSFAIVSIFSGRLFTLFGANKVKHFGIVINLTGALLLAYTALTAANSPLWITISMCIYSTGLALFINLIFADFMSFFPEAKGVSSALISSCRLVANAIMIFISGVFFTGSIIPVVIIIILLTAISAFCLTLLARE